MAGKVLADVVANSASWEISAAGKFANIGNGDN
jgi:hypothetical protein